MAIDPLQCGVAAHIQSPSWYTSGGVVPIVVELPANLSAAFLSTTLSLLSYAAVLWCTLRAFYILNWLVMCSLLWMSRFTRKVQHIHFPLCLDGVKFAKFARGLSVKITYITARPFCLISVSLVVPMSLRAGFTTAYIRYLPITWV